MGPQFLRKTVNFLNENSNYGGVVTLTTQVNEVLEGNQVHIQEYLPFNPGLKSIYITDMAVGNLFPPISFVYRRAVTDAIGLYNHALPVLGDWEYNLRFLEKFDIGVIYEPLANYHHRPNSDGVYGNTIYSGVSKHEEYDAVIRNNFIRGDIQRGAVSLGQTPSVYRPNYLEH